MVPDCEDAPEPLDNLQLQLPDRCTQQLARSPCDVRAASCGGPESEAKPTRSERVRLHAPRQDALAAAGSQLKPLLMMCLGGSFWRLYVHALPALARRITDVASGRSDVPLSGSSTLGRAAGSVMSSTTAGVATAVFGNGVASSVAASPRAGSADMPPSQELLPCSHLQELAVPTTGSAAVRGNGAVNGAGLACVRMFCDALVGDVGIAQHADGSMATFAADDLVAGGAIDDATFWGTSLAVEASGEGATNAGAGCSGQQHATKKRTAGRSSAAGASSGSMRAGARGSGSVADESSVDSAQTMQAVYHIDRPELPQASGDMPAGSNPSDVKQALDSDAVALMATGATLLLHISQQ